METNYLNQENLLKRRRDLKKIKKKKIIFKNKINN